MENQITEGYNDHVQGSEALVYTCIVNLGYTYVDVSIYDKDGRLVKYERLEHNTRPIEIIGKYFRLNRSEFYKEEVIIVSQVSRGVIEVLEKIIRIF